MWPYFARVSLVINSSVVLNDFNCHILTVTFSLVAKWVWDILKNKNQCSLLCASEI